MAYGTNMTAMVLILFQGMVLRELETAMSWDWEIQIGSRLLSWSPRRGFHVSLGWGAERWRSWSPSLGALRLA